jgi:hypothetical protein
VTFSPRKVTPFFCLPHRIILFREKEIEMSVKHPECPLYNHDNCRELDNPKLCALVREDKICIRKESKPEKKTKPSRLESCYGDLL